MVRVVGLLFTLEMAILGPSPSNLDFLTTKLDVGVQLFKTYKMSPLRFDSEGF